MRKLLCAVSAAMVLAAAAAVAVDSAPASKAKNALSGKEAAIGDFLCAKSRIRVRDSGGLPEGASRQLRYVAYSCIQFPDMTDRKSTRLNSSH